MDVIKVTILIALSLKWKKFRKAIGKENYILAKMKLNFKYIIQVLLRVLEQSNGRKKVHHLRRAPKYPSWKTCTLRALSSVLSFGLSHSTHAESSQRKMVLCKLCKQGSTEKTSDKKAKRTQNTQFITIIGLLARGRSSIKVEKTQTSAFPVSIFQNSQFLFLIFWFFEICSE